MILTATIVVGWIATYFAAANGRAHRGSDASPLRLAFYSLISREFYVADVYAWLTHATLGLSRRLNVWSRWVCHAAITARLTVPAAVSAEHRAQRRPDDAAPPRRTWRGVASVAPAGHRTAADRAARRPDLFRSLGAADIRSLRIAAADRPRHGAEGRSPRDVRPRSHMGARGRWCRHCGPTPVRLLVQPAARLDGVAGPPADPPIRRRVRGPAGRPHRAPAAPVRRADSDGAGGGRDAALPRLLRPAPRTTRARLGGSRRRPDHLADLGLGRDEAAAGFHLRSRAHGVRRRHRTRLDACIRRHARRLHCSRPLFDGRRPMSLALGRRLNIRATVHVAGEPIPFFWPMRTFIHHNPLYGLEHQPFEQAVGEGERLFHARGFLPRPIQQGYLASGKIDLVTLEEQVARFLATQPDIAGLDQHRLLKTLLTELEEPLGTPPSLADAADIHAALAGFALPPRKIDAAALAAQVSADMPAGRPLHAIVDMLFGTEIGATLNELVIKSCLDFFDEGQSVWQMPGREKGLFAAWTAVAHRNLRLFFRGLHIKRILAVDDTPEGIISHGTDELGVPEDDWKSHFACELTRLHGGAGFIRWRAGAKHYHWSRHYPADLVDYLAIRLVLGLALLREHAQRKGVPDTLSGLARFVEAHPAEAYLRREFHGGHVLPEMAHAVEDALAARRGSRIARVLPLFLARKREQEAKGLAAALRKLAGKAGMSDAMQRLGPEDLAMLTPTLARFEQAEGRIWLGALEARTMDRLLQGMDLSRPVPREIRPFAQLMFCIDVRSVCFWCQ